MKKSSELRQLAERYRRLKNQIIDPRAVQALCDLAGEFEMTATALDERQLVRERAHEIWVEQGRPEGRHLEHWVAAERELAVKGQRAKPAAYA